MVTQSMLSLHVYLKQRADEARAMIVSRAALIEPYIAQAKRATGKS